MFDISFTEIMVIAVVALIVVGPERLPKVARTLGHLLGRVRRYVSDVKNDIQREMEVEELNELHSSVQEAAHSIENSVREEVSELQAATDIRTTTTPTATSQSEVARDKTSLKKSSPPQPSNRSTK
ncbi:MAG: Sec-independent protein translocase protein TatB [Nitrosomonadaceae bacterium]|jgi:sec-independent protein translocase protein TatB|nr:Sec-independent protein translocase protein TatB [Betaproteobacteria bacterium]